MITRVCKHCGREYQTFASQRPDYCSRSCASEAKKRGQFADCPICGKSFWRYASKPDRQFCSLSCAITARNRTDQNPAYHRDITGERNPMYGKGMSGERNPMYGKRNELSPRWKGGRKIRKDGYTYAVAPDDHPYPSMTKASGLKYVLVHRLVMESILGRYLLPDEVVHHRDGNPSNNAPDNLELYSSQAEHIRTGH